MVQYYQQQTSENTIGSSMTMLSKLGYTIFSVVPKFSQNKTEYIIIYFKQANK